MEAEIVEAKQEFIVAQTKVGAVEILRSEIGWILNIP